MSPLTRSSVGRVLGPALFGLTLGLPLGGLDFPARAVLATAVWMATWWITEAVPIYATALLPLLVFPLLGPPELLGALSHYADRIIWLFLGGFMLARAIEKSRLDRRFALTVLHAMGTNPRFLVAGFMWATASMSAWISNTATTMLMLPIAVAVIAQVEDPERRDRFATCLMLSIAYAASLGGMATLIGTPPNAIFASLATTLAGVEVSFGRWMAFALPISLVSLVVTWWYMVSVGAPVSGKQILSGRGVLAERLAALGKMGRDEKLVAGVFAATAFAWLTRGLVWGDLLPMVDDAMIALVAAFTLFALPSSGKGGVLDWETAVRLPWGVLLLMGGGLALAGGFTATGLDVWIAQQVGFLAGMPPAVILLAVVGATIFASEILSNTATAAILIPIAASLATELHLSPLLLMLPVALATSYGFTLPVGTPPNAIVFASGHVTAWKMARAGFPLDLIGVGIVVGAGALLAPLMWS